MDVARSGDYHGLVRHEVRKLRAKSDADFTLFLICGRWKVPILMELHDGPRRTGELVRALPGVSKNRLNDSLRGLRGAGLVRRREIDGAIPRVEHELTALGASIYPIVDGLHDWGVRNRRKVEKFRAARRG